MNFFVSLVMLVLVLCTTGCASSGRKFWEELQSGCTQVGPNFVADPWRDGLPRKLVTPEWEKRKAVSNFNGDFKYEIKGSRTYVTITPVQVGVTKGFEVKSIEDPYEYSGSGQGYGYGPNYYPMYDDPKGPRAKTIYWPSQR